MKTRLTIAFIITILCAYYQRKTGPTYPISGELSWQTVNVKYSLTRSHGGSGNQPVQLEVANNEVSGYLLYRRYKTDDPWTSMKMFREENQLEASLPHQPPAGKLEYFILLDYQDRYLVIPSNRSAVTRFKGDVPTFILLAHVLAMFIAMLLSTATGLEALSGGKYSYHLTLWTSGLLFVGGMILGPVVQKFAFGEFWTGIPWGFDLTDNKTLIAMLAWIIAIWKGRKSKYWIIFAAIVLLAVYLIPHSMLGSELNYETMEISTGN